MLGRPRGAGCQLAQSLHGSLATCPITRFMTLAFDLPDCKASFLQRMDPRWKLAALLLAALSFALLRTWGPALAALAGTLLLSPPAPPPPPSHRLPPRPHPGNCF